MNPTKPILVYLRGLEESVMLLKVPNVLLPFVVFTALQCIVLFALTFFTAEPFTGMLAPLLERLGGPQALHYPMHYVLLPGMYHSIYLPMSIVVGFVLFGWAVFQIGDHYGRSGARIMSRPPFRRMIPSAILVGAIYVAAASLIPAAVAAATSKLTIPLAGLAGKLAAIVAGASVQAFLVYALLFLRVRTRNPLTAIADSVRFARTHFLSTVLVILTVMAIHFPVDYLISQPHKVVLKFRPELVFHVLLLGIAVEFITNYLLLSATASIALSRREEVV